MKKKTKFALITASAAVMVAFCASCKSKDPDIYIINQTPAATGNKPAATPARTPRKATPQTSWKSNPESIEPIKAPSTYSY